MDADSAWDALAKAKANLKKVDKVVNEAVDDASRYSLIGEQDIEAINKQFNEDLEEYIKDNLPTGFRFNLGMPSKYLISGGFDNLPISMRAFLISRKVGDNSHPFTPSEL